MRFWSVRRGRCITSSEPTAASTVRSTRRRSARGSRRAASRAPSLSFKTGESGWVPLSDARGVPRSPRGGARRAVGQRAAAASVPPAPSGAPRRRERVARRAASLDLPRHVRRRPLLPRPRGPRPPEALHVRRLRHLVARRRHPHRDELAEGRAGPRCPSRPERSGLAGRPRESRRRGAARAFRSPSPPPSTRTPRRRP